MAGKRKAPRSQTEHGAPLKTKPMSLGHPPREQRHHGTHEVRAGGGLFRLKFYDFQFDDAPVTCGVHSMPTINISVVPGNSNWMTVLPVLYEPSNLTDVEISVAVVWCSVGWGYQIPRTNCGSNFSTRRFGQNTPIWFRVSGLLLSENC